MGSDVRKAGIATYEVFKIEIFMNNHWEGFPLSTFIVFVFDF